MGKKIRLSEEQFNVLLDYRLIKEYGVKGKWKEEWNPEDQMLAMYNSFYGIEELGLSKNDVAENIIGTSVDSFNQQSSNFDFLDGRGGLDRESHKQTSVYEKYKNVPKYEFKKLCLDIIQKRIENPESAAIKKKLGAEIANKREEIAKERERGLLGAGISKEKIPKMTLIKSNPLNPPAEDDTNDINRVSDDYQFKEDIKSYLVPIISRMKAVKTLTDVNKLVVDLEFIVDYIDNELGETSSQEIVAEIRKIFKIVL